MNLEEKALEKVIGEIVTGSQSGALLDFLIELVRMVGLVYAKRWGGLKVPYYDHRLDWALGPEWWMWYERGVFGCRYIQEGDHVLDVCCGDGFYAGACYADVAETVHGVDRNEEAIAHAKRLYSRENVAFYVLDALREPFPIPHYDIVTLFASIEHFSERDGRALLRKIAKCLANSKSGLLIGSTPILDERWAGRLNYEHGSEFFTVSGLFAFLWASFDILDLWESKWGLKRRRRELYWLCGPKKSQNQWQLLRKIYKLLDEKPKVNGNWVALERAHFSAQWFFDENGENPVFLHWRAAQ